MNGLCGNLTVLPACVKKPGFVLMLCLNISTTSILVDLSAGFFKSCCVATGSAKVTTSLSLVQQVLAKPFLPVPWATQPVERGYRSNITAFRHFSVSLPLDRKSVV